MKLAYRSLLQEFRAVMGTFDDDMTQHKYKLLRALTEHRPPMYLMAEYQELLLFAAAYPDSPEYLNAVIEAFDRLATYRNKAAGRRDLENTGLPCTDTVAHFSYELLQWMQSNTRCRLSLASLRDKGSQLNHILHMTLPAVEKHLTLAGYSNKELFGELGIHSRDRLHFLLNELRKLKQAEVRDYCLEQLDIDVRISPTTREFSKAFNRIGNRHPFYHHALLKQFDSNTLINTPLPDPNKLKPGSRNTLIKVIRHDLALLQRETDPSTYLSAPTLRLYALERGISVALYGMTRDRQLPCESYVGYTLFKNGFPAAYGGGWIFGSYALFGINIHDAYRGGESGYVFCQLLRVYRQVFGIRYFEVEPYQFGKDNPEGIDSGAYWFYYRYGFRSIDPTLQKLAAKEYTRIKADHQYRTRKHILRQFTKSNCALNLGTSVPPNVEEYTSRITEMINRNFDGDRNAAAAYCIKRFKALTNMRITHRPTLEEMALLHSAMRIRSSRKTQLLAEMVKIKPADPYRYQELLRQFLK